MRLSLTVATLIALVGAGTGGWAVATVEGAAPSAVPDDTVVTDLGLPPVTLLSPAVDGAGAVPTFSWDPVPGAAAYTLAVLTAGGEPIWAWQGTTASVVLGNWVELPPPDVPGPLITGDSVWFVVAIDPGGAPLALSPMRTVTP